MMTPNWPGIFCLTKPTFQHKSLETLRNQDSIVEVHVSDNATQTETKHLTTMNCRISAVMYFESRCLTSCPHLRKVSRVNPTHGKK